MVVKIIESLSLVDDKGVTDRTHLLGCFLTPSLSRLSSHYPCSVTLSSFLSLNLPSVHFQSFSSFEPSLGLSDSKIVKHLYALS